MDKFWIIIISTLLAAPGLSAGELAIDKKTLYLADSTNHVIYKIDLSSGKETLFAGKPGESGSIDGPSSEARFYSPSGLCVAEGNLYISDLQNQTIRRVNLKTGLVTTLAGKPGEIGDTDGPGPQARFTNPEGLVCVGEFLYIADTYNHTIRKLDLKTNQVSTLAGKAGSQGSTDGKSSAARFAYPTDLVLSGKSLICLDSQEGLLRKIDLETTQVSTILQKPSMKLKYPSGLGLLGNRLFITDEGQGRILEFNLEDGTHKVRHNQGPSPNYEGPAGIALADERLWYWDNFKQGLFQIPLQEKKLPGSIQNK